MSSDVVKRTHVARPTARTPAVGHGRTYPLGARASAEMPRDGFDTREALEHRLFGVHATQYLPEDGVLHAEGAPEVFRPELHFSLGGLVQPHERGNWERAPYAVVAPLSTLAPQLLSVMVHDTMVLGDLPLDPSVVLVLPEQEAARSPKGVRVVTYDPSKSSLRDVVDQVIQREGGALICGEPGTGAFFDSARIGPLEVNSPEFFSPLLEAYPHLSFGGHHHGATGDAHWLGGLDQWSQSQRAFFLPKQFGKAPTVETARATLDLVKHALGRVDALVASHAFPEASLERYRASRGELQRRLNLAEVDLAVRAEHGRSLAGVEAALIPQLEALADSKEALAKWIQENLERLPQVWRVAQEHDTPSVIQLAALSLPERHAFEARHPEIFSSADSAEQEHFRIAVDLYRILHVGFDRAEQEGIVSELGQDLETLLSSGMSFENFRGKWSCSILKNYFLCVDQLGERSNRTPDVLRTLALPELRRVLEVLDISLPEGPLDLQDVLRALPETRSAYEDLPPEITSPFAAALASVLGVKWLDWRDLRVSRNSGKIHEIRSTAEAYLPRPPFLNLNEATAVARFRDLTRDGYLAKLCEELRTPPSRVTPVAVSENWQVLHRLRALPEAQADMVLERLGLRERFHDRYGSWEQFWTQDRPFVELLAALAPPEG